MNCLLSLVAGTPENITVDGSQFFPRTLDVDWEPPLTGSSSVVGYIVEYEPWKPSMSYKKECNVCFSPIQRLYSISI